ncbi:hypothetical protein [Hymenobacter ruber]
MKLKRLLFLSLIVCSAYSFVGQNTRHLKKAAVGSNFCLADSLKQILASLHHKADAVMTFQYYYDNGVPESATVFWQASGKTYSKSLQNCQPSILVKYQHADTLFSFYRKQRIADLPKMEIPDSAPSHGMAYFIGVYSPGNTRFYNIKECQRHLLMYPNQTDLLPGEKPVEAKEDPRSIWVDLFEKVTKR